MPIGTQGPSDLQIAITEVKANLAEFWRGENASKFRRNFFSALGTACGWAIPALIVGSILF